MTPRSRMGLLTGLLVLAAVPARAEDWKPVYTKSQTYFVAKANFALLDELKSGKKDGPLPLSVENAKKEKVDSEAVLKCVKSQCSVVADNKAGGTYSTPAFVSARKSPISASTAEAASKRPDGVSESVWNVIVNSKMDSERWPQAALALEKLRKDKPEAYRKIAGGGNVTYELILTALSSGVARKNTPQQMVDAAAAIAEKEGKLPAAPTAPASAGTTPPGAPDQPAGAPAEDEEKKNDISKSAHAITKLIELLEQAAVKKDFADRIVAYISSAEGEKAFVKIDDAKKKTTALAQLRGATESWVNDQTGKPETRAKAAILYYVLGERGKAWLTSHENLADLTRPMPQLRNGFASEMSAYTVAGAGTGAPSARPYTGEADWITAFLTTALEKADAVLKKAHITKQMAQLSIGQNQQTPPAGAVAGQGNRVNGSLRGRTFGFMDLYGDENLMAKDGKSPKGAYVAWLPIPGKEGFRKISINVYSDDVGYGPPAKIRDRIGIFDITEGPNGAAPSNVFGQYFDLSPAGGERVFRLDDRRIDGIKYKLSMNNGNISFSAVDAKSATPVGKPMAITVGDLYERRRRHAEEDGYDVAMNGRNFRVFAQGGEYGTLLYYPLDANGNLKACGGGDTSGCAPELTAPVTKVGSNGRTEIIGSKTGLGYVGEKDGKPQGFNLAWRSDVGLWEAVETDSIEPRPKPPETGKKDDKKDDGKPDEKKPTTGGGEEDKPGAGGDTNAALADCKHESKGSFPLTIENEIYRTKSADKIAVFTEKSPASPGDANNSYMCVYGEKALTFGGVILKGDISLSGSQLVVKTANIDGGTKGSRFINAAQLKDAAEGEDGWLKNGGNAQWREVVKSGTSPSGYIYHFDVSSLKGRIPETLASADKVASVRLKREFAKGAQTRYAPEITVTLFKGENHLQRSMKALDEYAKGTICLEQKAKVEDYVKKVLDLKKFKDMLSASGGKDAPQPFITFQCKSMAEIQNAGDNIPIVKPFWTDGGSYLMASEGKILDPKIAP